MAAAALAGFALGFGLILVIGAQNAFVLRQGLRGAHVFSICLVCALSDAVLIAVGVQSPRQFRRLCLSCVGAVWHF